MPEALIYPAVPTPSCLFPDEAEVARLVMGTKRAKDWRARAIILERHGLPKIDPVMGGRFWPAVVAFWLRRYGLSTVEAFAPDGPENLDAL